ncbi:acyl-CoA dehydrogenase [Novosphingobium sp. PC22D]|uniref:acyl-CoA dehydrogenase family protein n=1 Tax=Novosphingobium sp. PC22D TaxID=1962403 RepID=UPI000BF0A741|nr:acyl-CoA dehydrogenase family protein [Novosphingobium sp. PC22D]PEQ11488.1 acyl-CoA dehydrogenase [Novosphingobium sp. PC22D]
MSGGIESVDDFRLRARAWIKANLGPIQPFDASQNCENDEIEREAVARDRALQRQIWDGGFAGICFPPEYGGLGLTPAHQRAFNEELAGHEFPSRFTVPTFSPCAAVLLEFGTPEQKAAHIPAILKGDEFWVQMLSEPGGGSDVAGATTSAVRDGDDWIINGSKVWTSRAWWADWGLCLARTNWDVPKHQGLTVFALPLHQPGIEIHRIERLSGETEACQEFFTDVRVPDSDRLGPVDGGWTVGSRWMYFERIGHNSPYVTRPVGLTNPEAEGPSAISIARRAGRLDDPVARDLIGEDRTLEIATHALQNRIAQAAASGRGNVDGSAVDRLFRGIARVRRATIEYEIAGPQAAAWTEEEDHASGSTGMRYLMRQVSCIGGGTTEIARNVIAERVLGMPRELSGDKGVPFRDVPRGPKRA